MLKNYFKTAWRSLLRNKIFSFITILGLGIGIACSLFIFLWIKNESSYDRFHEKGDRLYRVMVSDKDKNGAILRTYENTPGLLPDALEKEIPEVEEAATVLWEGDFLFTVNEKIGKEKGRYVSPNFFTMFTFPLLQGDSKTTLASPDNIVISEKLAVKYFGNQNPIGKIIRIGDKRDYMVSGIVANVPANSSIAFDFVMPIEHGFEDGQWMIDGWNHFGPYTYVLLREKAAIAAVNTKLKDFLFRHDKVLDDKLLSLQLFKDSYLYSSFTNGVADGGRIEYVRLFSIIAIFILLIACINFMNLTTARALKRAKEVGVRKVVGAEKGLLFTQFLLEAFITTFFAMFIAIGIVFLFLPFFNQVTGKTLSLQLDDPSLLVGLLVITVITGFIAGGYPALFLSSLNPISILKGTIRFRSGAALFRKGLVVFQFMLSIILIVCTIAVYRQMKYVQTKNLGLDQSNLIYTSVEGGLVKDFDLFKREALASGNIESISFCGTEPTRVGWWSPGMYWEGKDPNDKTLFAQVEVGYDFLKTLKIDLVEGRDFSPMLPTDSSNFIINETAARYMKLKNPLGAWFSHGDIKGKIIGVVKDFHIGPLQQTIAPVFINFMPAPEEGVAIIRTTPGKTKEAISTIGIACKKYNPKFPFKYAFVDDELNRQYSSEMLVGNLSRIGAFIAICISCMGLFGLSIFVAEQRRKEVGIRKVMGASVSKIVALFSKDFLVLVLIAIVIASPVAWWATYEWLQNFAYRVQIEWWVFASAGALAIIIALITISLNAIKAAVANPVKSLRTE